MKKTVLVFSMALLLLLSGLNFVSGQEQPKPKRDTVNMDTDAKPTYYAPVEDEKGKSSSTLIIVVAAVVVAGGAAFFFLKKKK
jgi:LPXTG-motif cell wall-anchored protein